MQPLAGKSLKLRAMEPSDIDLMYDWENDPETWIYSNTHTPFSRFHLEQYVLNSNCDIYTDKQLRLMISNKKDETVGCVDLFEFDPHNKRSGVGLLIDNKHRKKGYGSETLDIIIGYAKNTLLLHQLYCNIATNNKVSFELFKKRGFVPTGIKQQWIFRNYQWLDEHFLQLIF